MLPTAVTSAWRDVVYKGNDNYYLMGTSSDVVGRSAGGSRGRLCGGVRQLAGVEHVDAFGDDLRRGDGAAVCERHAGVECGEDGGDRDVGESVEIGGDAFNSQYFAGRIDEVRVYNTALSASQIQTDMNTPIGASGRPDTTPPTDPTGLTATAASQSQVNLAWTGSTDNVAVADYRVERCQGGLYDLRPGRHTDWRHVQRHRPQRGDDLPLPRPCGRRGRQPQRLHGDPERGDEPDTQPPTDPTGLSATAVSASQINLSWTASRDNVAVANYRVERCQGATCTTFVQLGTPTGTTYNDTGLTTATTYRYRVRAADAAGNLSGYTAIAERDDAGRAGHAAADGADGPLGDGGVARARSISPGRRRPTTSAVTGYRVERCQGAGCTNFVQVGTPTGTSFNDTGLRGGDELQLPGAGRGRGRQPERLLERAERDHAGGQLRPRRCLFVQRGHRDECGGCVGKWKCGRSWECELGDDGQVRERALVQRYERTNHGGGFGFARSDDGNDAGGVGAPDRRWRLARRDLQGARRHLLPRELFELRQAGDRWDLRQSDLRQLGVAAERLVASRGDL